MEENNNSWVSYSYHIGDEPDLEGLIALLENEVGGERHPYGARFGAIDLVTFFEIVIPFTAGVSLTPVLKKYFEGLLNADDIKKLGEKHRQEIIGWFKNVEANIKSLLSPIINSPKVVLPRYSFQGVEKAAALKILLGGVECFIVLNHTTVNKGLMDEIPKAVSSTIKLLMARGLPPETRVLQLYYDNTVSDWKFLFLPTTNGFGNYIDRYIDLESGELVHLNSPQDFVKTFFPDKQDRYKFLVDPFRYQEKKGN